MEKRFESELAKRISTGRGRASPFGAKFLALAISVCAVLSIAAAAVLGVVATRPAFAGPVEYTDAVSDTDYLIYELADTTDPADGVADEISVVATSDLAEEEVFAVKREMTIKSGVWDAPAPPLKQWTKVVYTVNLRLRDLAFTDPVSGLSASIEPVGLIVGDMDVIYNGVALAWVSESFTVNGCVPVDLLGIKADAVVLDDVTGAWIVKLPDLTGFFVGDGIDAQYTDGDSISVSLMLKAPYIAGSALEGTETAFDAIIRSFTTVPAPPI
jgi:hypothetical protein